jgi:hypothetical protein
MASAKTLMWIQRLVWIYIYGGLLSIVLSLFVSRTDEATATGMQVVGGIFVALGVVLILVRSRLKVSA